MYFEYKYVVNIVVIVTLHYLEYFNIINNIIVI